MFGIDLYLVELYLVGRGFPAPTGAPRQSKLEEQARTGATRSGISQAKAPSR